MTDELAPLTTGELDQLAQCEAVIERGLQTFFEVGSALMTIKEARLYRQEYPSFDTYCQERWGMGRNYAYKLIAGTQVVNSLQDGVYPGTQLPTTERQARALKRVPEAQRADVWRAVVERYGATASVKQIEAVIDSLTSDAYTADLPPLQGEPGKPLGALPDEIQGALDQAQPADTHQQTRERYGITPDVWQPADEPAPEEPEPIAHAATPPQEPAQPTTNPTDVEMLRAALNDTRRQLDQVAAQRDALKMEASAAQRQRDALALDLARLEGERERLQREGQETHDESQRLYTALTQTDTELRTVKRERDNLLQSDETERQQLQEQLTTAHQEIERLRSDMVGARMVRQGLEGETTRLTAALDQARSELATVGDERQQLETTNASLSGQVVAASKEIERLQSALDQANDTTRELMAQQRNEYEQRIAALVLTIGKLDSVVRSDAITTARGYAPGSVRGKAVAPLLALLDKIRGLL